MRFVAIAAGLAAALAPATTRAEGEAAAFFQNKQIQFFTMGSPGGGYDAYTRAIAARLEKSLGAHVVTINEPAAGGLVAMNRLLTARPDGLSLLLVGGESLAIASLMGEPGVNYDPLKQVWLARVSAESKVALIGPKSPYNSIADLVASQRPSMWAGSGKTDGNTDFQALLAHATGMKARMVIGYKGTGGMNIAMENGEIDGRVVSDESAALYGPSSGMRVIATLARQRAPSFPAAPTVFEAARLSPEAAAMLDWRAGIAALGRVIAVTPGAPADRVEHLRATLRAVLVDPGFIAEMRNMKLSASYAPASEVGDMMARAMKTLDARGLAEIKSIVIDRYY